MHPANGAIFAALMSSRTEFAILGAGAIGSILGAHLTRAGHAVTMLVRERRAAQLRSDGLRIKGLSEFATPVQMVPSGKLNGIAPGTTHTCALWGDDVSCWGDNFSGQLGISGGMQVFPANTGLSGIVAIGSGSASGRALHSKRPVTE